LFTNIANNDKEILDKARTETTRFSGLAQTLSRAARFDP
jgi:hypothetical protein